MSRVTGVSTSAGRGWFQDDHCPNCRKALPDQLDGLFDGEACKEAAKTVRYIRRAIADGRVEDPLVKAAIRRRLWFAVHGPYPAKARRLSAQTRAAVLTRDDHTCQHCGRPGNQIDHISGNSDALTNLQVLCEGCHNTKTDEALFGATDEADAREPAGFDDMDPAYVSLLNRAFVALPLLLADDESVWDGLWRQLLTERRDRQRARWTDAGLDPADWGTIPAGDRQLLLDDALMGDQMTRITEDDDGGYGPDSYFARSMERDD